jgi:hypothetical protein
MYSKEKAGSCKNFTADLIKNRKAGSITKKEIEKLRDALRFHEYRLLYIK